MGDHVTLKAGGGRCCAARQRASLASSPSAPLARTAQVARWFGWTPSARTAYQSTLHNLCLRKGVAHAPAPPLLPGLPFPRWDGVPLVAHNLDSLTNLSGTPSSRPFHAVIAQVNACAVPLWRLATDLFDALTT